MTVIGMNCESVMSKMRMKKEKSHRFRIYIESAEKAYSLLELTTWSWPGSALWFADLTVQDGLARLGQSGKISHT